MLILKRKKPGAGRNIFLPARLFYTFVAAMLTQAPAGVRAQAAELNTVPDKMFAVEVSATAALRIRGLVVPRRQAAISAAFAATIKSIGPDNGERFTIGDTLIEFDCGINLAELNRARALAQAARDTSRVKRKLARSGSISRLQAILATSEQKKAEADVIVAQTRVEYCVVIAPFSGRVVRRIANAYETVAPRDPLLEIVDDSEVEIRVYVPSLWLRRLKLGGAFKFTIDETGAVLRAKIIALGATIDNVSQLIEVRARVVASGVDGVQAGSDQSVGHNLLAGMSGGAEFPPKIAAASNSSGKEVE